jgi:hypothetical protein
MPVNKLTDYLSTQAVLCKHVRESHILLDSTIKLHSLVLNGKKLISFFSERAKVTNNKNQYFTLY